MNIRKALEELLSIVEIHQKNTGNNFAWAEVEHAKELLAEPEPDNTQYLLDQVCRLTAENAMLKEKWNAQAEQDLKREPLSDEVICEILLKKEWKGFVELIRKIEKAHGIEVDNE
jgi:hypothetical protein